MALFNKNGTDGGGLPCSMLALCIHAASAPPSHTQPHTACLPLTPTHPLTPLSPSVSLAPATISFSVPGLGYADSVAVFDIWAGAVVATTNGTFSTGVPHHGTAFYRLSAVS